MGETWDGSSASDLSSQDGDAGAEDRAAKMEAMAAFVPRRLVEAYHAHPMPPLAPVFEDSNAVVMLADLSGFSKMTSSVTAGVDGVEKVQDVLNANFSKLIDTVNAWGGDIVKFAGDAIVVIWESPTEGGIPEKCLLALGAGLQLQRDCEEERTRNPATLRLPMRVGIASGKVKCMSLGGLNGAWEFVVGGAPLGQVGACESNAKIGSVVISEGVRTLLGLIGADEQFSYVPVPDAPENMFSVDAANPMPAPASAANPSLRNLLKPELEPIIRKYVVTAATYVVEQNLTQMWSAELRRLSVIFVTINSLDLADAANLNLLDSAMKVVQTACSKYYVTVNKMLFDDKGIVWLLATGLPPHARETDTVNSIYAAMMIENSLTELGLKPSLGVATGDCFCGIYGTTDRREYTTLGVPVNLSARMMQQHNGIYVDEVTHEATAAKFEFESVDAFSAKGFDGPIQAWRPVAEKKTLNLQIYAHQSRIVGRRQERKALMELLDTVSTGSRSRCLIFEGEAGMGKSRLIAEAMRQARAGTDALDKRKSALEKGRRDSVMGPSTSRDPNSKTSTRRMISFLLGKADSIETSTPYFAFRDIVASLLGVDHLDPDLETEAITVQVERILKSMIAENLEIMRSAPLLNPFIKGLNMPDNDFTSMLQGEARADNTRNLLTDVFNILSQQQSHLFVLEDAHWMDSQSWKLALAVISQCPRVSILMTTRPMADPVPTEYKELARHDRVTVKYLSQLSAEDTSKLVCMKLGVKNLPQEIEELLQTRASGHPFFAEEIAHSMRDAGVIVIGDGGTCTLSKDPAALEKLSSVPTSVHGVVTERIGMLNTAQQLTLKVASVIGRTFRPEIVAAVHPLNLSTEGVIADLQILSKLDLTPLESNSEHGMVFYFKHAILQAVSYQLMLYSQRRQLHRAVALHVEKTAPNNHNLLAHHFLKAEMTSHARRYLELAAEDAVRAFANTEAVKYVNQLVELLDSSSDAARLSVPKQRAVIKNLVHKAQSLKGKRSSTVQPTNEPSAPNKIGTMASYMSADDDGGALDEVTYALKMLHYRALLGVAYYGMGDINRSHEHSEKVLSLLGHPQKKSKLAGVLNVLSEAKVVKKHYKWLKKASPAEYDAFLNAPPNIENPENMALKVAALLGKVYYFRQDKVNALRSSLLVTNFVMNIGAVPDMAFGFGNMIMVCTVFGLKFAGVAEVFFKRGVKLAEHIDTVAGNAHLHQTYGIYNVGVARLEKSRELISESMRLSETVGDWRRWEETSSAFSTSYYVHGLHQESAEAARRHFKSAERRGDRQSAAMGLNNIARNLVLFGDLEEASNKLALANEYMAGSMDLGSRIIALGLRAFIHVRQGDARGALDRVGEAFDLIAKGMPMAAFVYGGIVALTSALLELFESQQDNKDTSSMGSQSKLVVDYLERSIKLFHKFAKSMIFAKVRAYICEARFAYLRNKNPVDLWAKASTLANDYEMHLELAYISLDRARRAVRQQKAGTTKANTVETIGATLEPHIHDELKRAYDIFSARGIKFEASLAQELLG